MTDANQEAPQAMEVDAADVVELPSFTVPRVHLEHPAAVVNLVDPEVVPTAKDILQKFEEEMYPRTEGAPERFLVQFSEWGPVSCVVTMVFPREGIPRLSEICAAHGAVLIRGVMTAFNEETKERIPFDLATAVSDLIDTVPAVGDVYTFGVRTSEATPLIICGAHENDLPESVRLDGHAH